eukprot:g40625.t1
MVIIITGGPAQMRMTLFYAQHEPIGGCGASLLEAMLNLADRMLLRYRKWPTLSVVSLWTLMIKHLLQNAMSDREPVGSLDCGKFQTYLHNH